MELGTVDDFIREHNMRISMHPDQFVLINALDADIVARTITELEYHARVLDSLGLDGSAKIQIHIGGVYGNRASSLSRFGQNYRLLHPSVRQRLVIENDDRAYTVADCLKVSEITGIPVLFDVFHHEVNGGGQPVAEVISRVAATWKKTDGIPMVDYSSQEPRVRKGNHAARLDPRHFLIFLNASQPFDLDIMLEIKEKEAAAITALRIAGRDKRLLT
jgi:UV DNA damage endonuclease